jgi:hypothetical protein
MSTEHDQIPAWQLELAVAQYQEVRSEIGRILQAKTALIGLALTASSALAAYGFSSEGRREVLLILPYVLAGLALIYLNYSVIARTDGDYLRAELWPFLQNLLSPADGGPPKEVPCWEGWTHDRQVERGRSSSAGLTTLLGQGIVFGAPALAALILTYHLAWSDGWSADRLIWLLGALVLVGSVLLVGAVDRRVITPRRRSA